MNITKSFLLAVLGLALASCSQTEPPAAKDEAEGAKAELAKARAEADTQTSVENEASPIRADDRGAVEDRNTNTPRHRRRPSPPEGIEHGPNSEPQRNQSRSRYRRRLGPPEGIEYGPNSEPQRNQSRPGEKTSAISLNNVKCFVTGSSAKKEYLLDYKGGKVFFCNNGCSASFSQNKKKFAAAANFQLFATGQAKQLKCPLTERSISPQFTVDLGGKSVGFCSAGCKNKIAQSKGNVPFLLVFNEKSFDRTFLVPAQNR